MKPYPVAVAQQLAGRAGRQTIYLSSVTMAEMLFDIRAMPDGRRKQKLVTTLDGLLSLSGGITLPFDTEAARRYCGSRRRGAQCGKGFSVTGRLLAAIATTHWLCCRHARHGRPDHQSVNGQALNVLAMCPDRK